MNLSTNCICRLGLMLVFGLLSDVDIANAETTATPVIVLDGRGGGRTFDGVGALSAGASSRLLYDYPEPERSEILDYLFKPGYGAALQILKVEIGGDSNSTSGSEPSHMRTPTDLNGERGYEWWLMKEAKARNPEIKLWGLEWSAPDWFQGGFWSKDNIDYLLAWLRLAERQGLKIDYMGGWNETGFNMRWYMQWHAAIAKHYPHVKIVGSDDIFKPWAVVDAMLKNPKFCDAIDIVGVHDPCFVRTEYKHCPVPAGAFGLKKALWTSEQSSQGHDVGAIPLARAMNRQYVEGRITANVVWSLISAWYSDLPMADTGLLLADRPWSGYYLVGKSVWVHAHTTQFTRIAWQYIDSACGYLSDGASYVTLKSPDGEDFTTIIETMDTPGSRSVRFEVAGGFPAKKVHFWSTDLASSNPKDHFVHLKTIRPKAGAFSVTLEPRHVYTLSTTTGQGKGRARSKADPAAQIALPYTETFESCVGSGKLARYFSDLEGAFESAPCGGGRTGQCYRQVASSSISWHNHKKMPPTTVVGDPRWWGDYEIGVDVLLEQKGYVEVLGRIASQRVVSVAGYHLQFNSEGRWNLYSQDLIGADTELASGESDFRTNTWHRLGLRLVGDQIEVLCDGKRLGEARSDLFLTGQVGFRVSPGQNAQFDNLSITRTAPAPRFLPHDRMKAVATSEHAANHRGYTFEAANAIDDRPETAWRPDWEANAQLPQSITLDIGGRQKINGLVCQPSLNRNPNGSLSDYRVYLSRDGKTFKQVACGTWPIGTGSRQASWPAESARYVRLEATEKSDGLPFAAEINICEARNGN